MVDLMPETQTLSPELFNGENLKILDKFCNRFYHLMVICAGQLKIDTLTCRMEAIIPVIVGEEQKK